MKNKTVTITVRASFDDVYDFLSDPESMPLWAVHFCKSIRKEDGRWIITTPGGSLYFSIDSCRAGGSIDMYAGPTLESMNLFPIRVIRADSGETAVVFSFFKCDTHVASDEVYLAQYQNLIVEAGLLLERFGGGEISAEKPIPSKLYVGLICSDIAATKSFYAENLGFRVTFDAPSYAHLERPCGGEQIGLMALLDRNETAQKEFENPSDGKGMWLSFEVENVDEEYDRLKAKGIEIRQGATDQPWGERTCILVDPNGVLIYLGQKTDTMDEELKQFIVKDESVMAPA